MLKSRGMTWLGYGGIERVCHVSIIIHTGNLVCNSHDDEQCLRFTH